ncbi:MAG TPA: NCS2 family permease [Clostridia bacterium]|nr:NCS2 family permease [Clostridia bacterium]
MDFFERVFKLEAFETNVKTEMLAGLTTFMTMAYILAVNPGMLSETGMDIGAVFTATALASFIGTMVMAFHANLPFALAPGMGLNAFFVYTVVFQMGYSWQFALTAVLLEGIIFILLTIFNIREAIINSIPENVKKAISVGIGLFIAFIGFTNAGIIIQGQGVPLMLGDLTAPNAIVAIAGLLLMAVLLSKNVKGALFFGIVGATILSIPLGVTSIPTLDSFTGVPSLEPIMFQFRFDQILTVDMVIVLFTFLFVDMFDTVGTLIGVSEKAGMITEDGKIPNVKQALMADAVGTTCGAMLGTSTVTTYVESAAGVAEGGRTGLTAFTTGILFFLALFFAPLFLMVPGAATAPALIIVGLFMMSPIKKIDFTDYTEAVPAFLTIIIMPLAYAISEGIIFGILSYVLLKIFSGRQDEVPKLSYLLALLFIIKIIFV